MQQTLAHPISGATIFGIRLVPGTKIGENDKYDSTDGKWRTAGLSAGGEVPVGNHVMWVRQPSLLSDKARTLLDYLCQRPWGERTCIGERSQNFYIIPGPTFNWDGRFDIEAMRVQHPECVQELVDHGYLVFGEYEACNSMSDYSTVGESYQNSIYTLTHQAKKKGEEILAN
jgi:hypothetical protein